MYWHLAHDTLQPTLRTVPGCAKGLPREMWRADTGLLGTSGGSTCAWDRGTVRDMKPFIIFALWAFAGWDVGAWAEAYVGIPTVIGAIAGIALGVALAVRAQQQLAGTVDGAPHTAELASFDAAPALDRAA
jgi:hypothetical protein